jgi:hypothetical protein
MSPLPEIPNFGRMYCCHHTIPDILIVGVFDHLAFPLVSDVSTYPEEAPTGYVIPEANVAILLKIDVPHTVRVYAGFAEFAQIFMRVPLLYIALVRTHSPLGPRELSNRMVSPSCCHTRNNPELTGVTQSGIPEEVNPHTTFPTQLQSSSLENILSK